MREPSTNRAAEPRYDVVVCGGGLAGLLLARQLRRELPQLSVCVVERTTRPLPDACHKVGESSVELGCQYFERLGLRDYLLDRHLVKFGLRFFPGGGEQPLAERTEIGPSAEPIVRSYQIDRGRFEHDVRGMIEQDGATLIEGARVTAIDLGKDGADHAITCERDGVPTTLRARWVADASGRQALLRKGMKLTRGSQHLASAGWFRIPGRVGPNDLVPASEQDWHKRPGSEVRWRSTNHFMGPGYWAWLIPLSTGHTSVGLVIHEEVHDYMCIAGIERTMEFLRRHEPHLAAALEGKEVKDFLCLRKYCHQVARAWSEDRWALVGEAGAFVDPLYSPGSDFIALANSFTVEMIRADGEGRDLQERARHLNLLYRALVSGAIELFRSAAPVYGHPTGMATKVMWDNFSYWSFTCHHSQQELHRLSSVEYEPFGVVGRRFLQLGGWMQSFLRHLAQLAPEPQRREFIGAPHFPSVLIDAHIKVAQKMTPAETLQYMRERLAQAEEMAGEIVLRTLQQIGPDRGRELLQRADFANWGITIPAERLELEELGSMARRGRLSVIARDVERTLGPVRRHERAGAARQLLAARSEGAAQ